MLVFSAKMACMDFWSMFSSPTNAQPTPNSKSSPEQPSASPYERSSPMTLQEAQPQSGSPISVIEAYKRGLSFESYRRVSKPEGQQPRVIVSAYAEDNHDDKHLVSIPIEIDASELDKEDQRRLQMKVHGIYFSLANCKELREARIEIAKLFNVSGVGDK